VLDRVSTNLSLSNTISEIEKFDVDWSRETVHDRVRKVDLQPVSNAGPGRAVLDELVIQVDDQ